MRKETHRTGVPKRSSAESTGSDPGDLVWRALGDSARRRMLDLLRGGPMTTGELCLHFSFSRYAVMKHLNVLEHASLILVERKGRQRLNHLNPVPIQEIYRRWIRPFEVIPADRLLRIKSLVEGKKLTDKQLTEEQLTEEQEI